MIYSLVVILFMLEGGSERCVDRWIKAERLKEIEKESVHFVKTIFEQNVLT